tara:strand:+ start:8992 stop:10140 length:1149 start_codon:yes stop_codon:yes gene_type:complete
MLIKSLGIAEFGVFGLFQSTVIIMTFFLGLDFYTFTAREILKLESKEFSYYIKHQIIFHTIAYILILPFCYFLVLWNIIQKEFIYLFIIILVSEHLSQEIYRILIILKKTVVATLVLFLRSGLWIILTYLLWKNNFIPSSLESLLYLWLLGAALSVIIGFYYLDFKWIQGVDKGWIKEGLIVAFPFFIGTILYKMMEFSGRYFLNFYFTSAEVGVYTFFSSIANVMFVFVQTIVIIELYPSLIESKNKSYAVFLNNLRTFEKQTIKFSTIGIVLSLLGIYPLLAFLNKTILFDSIFSYILLLISTAIFSLSFIPHYALYSYNHDWKILQATLIGALFNVAFNFLLIPTFGVMGAAISQLVSFFILFVVKVYFWKKFKKIISK